MENKMTILIVEDDAIQLKTLKIAIQKFNPNNRIYCADNYTAAKDLLKEYPIQIFLLDVELDKINAEVNGIELAKEIRQMEQYMFTPIIFITSIPEKIQSALHETHCFDYILKPYTQDSLYKSLNLVIKSPNITEKTFCFCDIQGIHVRIKEKDILFCESNGHLIHIHTFTSTYVTSDRSLDNFRDKLSPVFFRCHKKYIINMTYADSYDKTNRFVMLNNHSIPVGRSYKQNFEERYQN